jgi:hypothetical protein
VHEFVSRDLGAGEFRRRHGRALFGIGDIVVHPFPFATHSYIGEWAAVLRKVIAMDTVAIVPGHGPVMRDKAYITDMAELMESIDAQAKAAYVPGMSLADLRKKIDLAKFKQRFAGDDKFIEFVKLVQPGLGGVNLEDIAQPKCFRILDTLREECEIPVWHDDQQGTACVTLAGLINAAPIGVEKFKEWVEPTFVFPTLVHPEFDYGKAGLSLFVAVLGASNLTYAEATRTPDVDHPRTRPRRPAARARCEAWPGLPDDAQGHRSRAPRRVLTRETTKPPSAGGFGSERATVIEPATVSVRDSTHVTGAGG